MVLAAYAFTAIFLGLGLVAFWGHGQHLAILLGLAVLIVLLLAGQMNFSREWFAVGRVLGNSLNMRSKIQYALAQTRWLEMEGTRSEGIAALCEDTVFIARKLGFDSVHIQMEDGERSWQINPVGGKNQRCFLHRLPGGPSCFIKLGIIRPAVGDDFVSDGKAGNGSSNGNGTSIASGPKSRLNGNTAANDYSGVDREMSILSELLAEAWGKAIVIWQKQNQLPPRFDGQKMPDSKPQAKDIGGVQLGTVLFLCGRFVLRIRNWF